MQEKTSCLSWSNLKSLTTLFWTSLPLQPNNFNTIPDSSAASLKSLPTLLMMAQCRLIITFRVDGERRRGLVWQMNRSVASNFLHKRHSQVSKQRTQGLFIDLKLRHLKRTFLLLLPSFFFFFCLMPAAPVQTFPVCTLTLSFSLKGRLRRKKPSYKEHWTNSKCWVSLPQNLFYCTSLLTWQVLI